MALPEKLIQVLSSITTPTELSRVLGKHKSAGSRIMSGDQDISREDMAKILQHYSKLSWKMFL